MRWLDLDRREGWWNIPAELTKRPYRVPITPAMLAIIEEMEKLALDPEWVFPSAAGGGPVPETNVTRPFRRLIKDAGIAHFMPHDLLHTRRPSLGPMQTERWPDDLSDWALPPAGARSAGNSEPVRVFDTAEAALACLLRLLTPAIGSGGRRKVG